MQEYRNEEIFSYTNIQTCQTNKMCNNKFLNNGNKKENFKNQFFNA